MVCGIGTAGHADTQQTVGESPAAYTTPTFISHADIQYYKHLMHMRDTGQLSAADFQRLLMERMGNTKRVSSSNTPSILTPIQRPTPGPIHHVATEDVAAF